ncbi:MAG: hypothetical protein LC632_08535 [Xanthomonadaceae bacterium]|nr:hypothetical protein [Xanthomonadaceae bacterium]
MDDEVVRLRAEYDALVHAISHDLRAPLRSITGFGAALREEYAGKLGDDGERYLQHMMDGALVLSESFDGLLELSRVGTAPLVRAEVDLVPLVRDTLDKLRAGAPPREVDLQTPKRLVVSADRMLTRLLVRHLVGNAWRFTAENAITEIRLSADGSEGAPQVTLADNGVGFDPSLTTGAGIGLAVVRRIIERHGGWIEVDSQQDQGTTVRFAME